MNVKQVKHLLNVLRWDVDQVVVSSTFSELVWLKACVDESGERIGITDCCFANDPCEYHKTFSQKS